MPERWMAPVSGSATGHGVGTEARRSWRALAVALLIVVSPAWGEKLTPARRAEIVREAQAAFDAAVAATRDNPALSTEQYRRSAAALESLLEDGVSNAAIEHNLGNAYMRLGETGKAILHYRRGQRLNPGVENLNANLAYARNRVQPAIPDGARSALAENLLFWHHRTPLRTRYWAAGGFSLLGWLILTVRLWRRRVPLSPGLLAVGLGLACAASAGWQAYDEGKYRPGVVIEGSHVLRLGRGDAFDAALREPLGPGVELRVLERYGDWVEVRLNNGLAGWLPAAAVNEI